MWLKAGLSRQLGLCLNPGLGSDLGSHCYVGNLVEGIVQMKSGGHGGQVHALLVLALQLSLVILVINLSLSLSLSFSHSLSLSLSLSLSIYLSLSLSLSLSLLFLPSSAPAPAKLGWLGLILNFSAA